MSNKEIIQSILPNAKIESHTQGIFKKKYYLIRNGRETMYLAEGETPAKAWKNALPTVLKRAKVAIQNIESDKMLRNIKTKTNDRQTI